MPSTKTPDIYVLMGPTGSGKSALAMRVAQARPTIIINADAMQMVDTLRILTARPTEQEEKAAEHALYGVLAPEFPTSVAAWLTLVEPVIHRAFAENKLPLLVGGTGMYIKALMEGLASVPPIPESIRQTYRTMDHAKLYTELRKIDPLMADRLKPGDTQRITRALEVIAATGTSLASWQAKKSNPLFPGSAFKTFHIDIHRPKLYAQINHRFERMMQAGALDEARYLMTLNLPPDTPITKAHGVPELIAHLRGEMSLESAITKAQQNTRNYAKRQMTWIRNQMPEAVAVTPDADTEFFIKS